ncbi:MAG: hypothetical protein EOL93_00555 [Epsilonproteobacteria bacterium]|nr:hypothetical protein [Campylobacterota bacterium]
MSKMTIEIDEEGLIKGNFDGLGKMNVDVEYVKDLIFTCRRLTLRNTALMHDLAEVATERDKLLKALGGESDVCMVIIDNFDSNLDDFLSHIQKRKSI